MYLEPDLFSVPQLGYLAQETQYGQAEFQPIPGWHVYLAVLPLSLLNEKIGSANTDQGPDDCADRKGFRLPTVRFLLVVDLLVHFVPFYFLRKARQPAKNMWMRKTGSTVLSATFITVSPIRATAS